MEDKELNEVLERIIASLTDEQKQKAAACKTVDDLINLLGELGVELPDELLDDVGGGLNLSTFFNRPTRLPVFSSLFSRGVTDVEATHADIKGTPSMGVVHADLKGMPSVGAVHTDVSAAPAKKGSARYV